MTPEPYIVFAPCGPTAVLLDQSVNYVHAWQLAGKVKREQKLPMVSVGSIRQEPDDPKHVSDEQLGRHILWRATMWAERWPHRHKELLSKAEGLALQFGPRVAAIPQQHRWEFLWRLAALAE